MPKEITTENAKARLSELLAKVGQPDAYTWNSSVVTCINYYLGATSSYAISATKLLGSDLKPEDVQPKLARMLASIIGDLNNEDVAIAGETGFFDAYQAFTTKLRLWLLTYGIGLVATMVTTKELFELSFSKRTAWFVIGFVLIGVLAQLVLMLVYKFAMWYKYEHEYGRLPNTSKRYIASRSISSNVIAELTADLVSMGSLLVASCIFVFGITGSPTGGVKGAFWQGYDQGNKAERLIQPEGYINYLRTVRFTHGELDSLPTDAIVLHDARPERFLQALGYDTSEWKRLELGETDPNVIYVVRSKTKGDRFILNPGLPGAGGIATQVGELGALGVKRVVHVGTCGVFGSVPAKDTLLISSGAYADGAAALLTAAGTEFLPPDERFTDELLQACGASGLPAHRCAGFTVPVFYAQPTAFMRTVATTTKTPAPVYVEMEGAAFFAMAHHMGMRAASLLAATDRYQVTRSGLDHAFIEYDADGLKQKALGAAIRVFRAGQTTSGRPAIGAAEVH